MKHRILTLALLYGLPWSGSTVVSSQAQSLQGYYDESLDYPIRVVEAEPYWQPAGEWALDSPVTTLGAMRALYMLSQGHGYSGSVVMKEGTVITVAGDGQLSRVGQPSGRLYTLQALRWRP